MIQEIYNYLCTRNILLGDEIVLINENDEKIAYQVASSISNLIREETMFLNVDEIRKSLLNFVQRYRFRYSKESKVDECMNNIIVAINEAKTKNQSESDNNSYEWLMKEYDDRDLPKEFRNERLIFTSIRNENNLFMNMNGYYSEDGINYKKTEGINFSSLELIEFAGLINLLINRYPSFYCFDGAIDTTVEQVESLFKYIDDKVTLRYYKKTVHNLKCLEKEIKKLTKVIKKEMAN